MSNQITVPIELVEWARMAAETTRAQLPEDADEEGFTPSWLPELEAVLAEVKP